MCRVQLIEEMFGKFQFLNGLEIYAEVRICKQAETDIISKLLTNRAIPETKLHTLSTYQIVSVATLTKLPSNRLCDTTIYNEYNIQKTDYQKLIPEGIKGCVL